MFKTLTVLMAFALMAIPALAQPGTGNPLVYAPHTYGYNATNLTNLPAGQVTGAFTTIKVGNVTNTPSFTIVNTNWISGQLYTNLTGRPIEVKCQAILFAATTGVGGAAQLGLQTNGVNMYSVLISPTATTSVNDDRLISGWIPSGVTFAFTNLSTGTGNTATSQWGQYMVY